MCPLVPWYLRVIIADAIRPAVVANADNLPILIHDAGSNLLVKAR